MTNPRPALIALSLTAAALFSTPTAAQIVAYHDENGATHQQQHNLLSLQGFRMIALSIYGSTNSPSYAAVWVQRPGPAWVAFHGYDAAQYQAFANVWGPQGYRPKILTATGSAANPRFAGTFELTNAAGWLSHGLTEAQFWAERSTAQQQDLDVTTVDIYGTSANPRYIVAFGPVDAGQAEVVSTSDSNFQTHFDALGSGHARPALVAFNDEDRYVSLWQSNDVGPWVAHHNMTSAEYQNYANLYWNQGRYPISIQGSGSGGSRRFAAVWAPSDLPITPTFTTTGSAVGPLVAFDTWAQNWMNQTETRAAAMAIVKDGKLVLARGYTNASAGYPITQPTDLFEIASCTKPITSIAMHQHFEDPQTTMAANDTMMSYFPNTVPVDPRMSQITLNSLLTHQGGWDRTVSPDPMVGLDATIATALLQPLPIGKSLIFQYTVGTQMLDFTPNNGWQYSNFGYCALGMVLEADNLGTTYEQIIDDDIFSPLGLTRPQIADSLTLFPGEVTYHPYVPVLARSVMDDTQPWVAGQYGMYNKENMDSHGAWVMAAPDYAKILAAFDLGASNPLLSQQSTTDMWTLEPGFNTMTQGWFMEEVSDGQGGTVRMHHHNGRLIGAVSFIAKREDGLSFVFLTNGDRQNLSGATHGTQLSNIANLITAWPQHDLFPSMGIPSFVQLSGTVTPIGSACSGTAAPPQFTTNGAPNVGESHAFLLSNAAPTSLAFMVLGLQQTSLSLASFGAPQCSVYTNSLATFATVTGTTGGAQFQWQTPPTSAAIGLPVVTQAAFVDPWANALGIVTTNGLRVTLGGWQ